EIYPTVIVDSILKDRTEKMLQQSLKIKKELAERLAMRMISKAKGKGIENSNQNRDVWEEKSSNKLDNLMRESRDERRSDANKGNFGVQDSGKVFGEDSLGDDEEVKAATRAFMLRVASKEGWNIAAGIRDTLDDDPIEVYLQERLVNVRQ
ncbi:15227_t:CDS:2, partial [Cetraspora pellucida]